MIKKIAIYEGKVQGFIYQSTECEELECEFPDEWLNEPIFTESQQNRFYVKDGVVCKYTDEELQNQPRYIEYLREQKKARFEAETDELMYDIIEKLAQKFEAEIPEVKEWLGDKAKIRLEFE